METNIDTLKNLCGFDRNFLMHRMFCAVCKKLFTGDIKKTAVHQVALVKKIKPIRIIL
jgi:hypothetical protein